MNSWSEEGLRERIKQLWDRKLNTVEIARYVQRPEAQVARIVSEMVAAKVEARA